MTKPIDIRSFPDDIDCCRYAAIYCAGEINPEDAFCLTPHVMQWSNNIYLFDLETCINYWSQQAHSLNISLSEIYEKILCSVFGDKAIAVFGHHPWQSLLFLNYLIHDESIGVHALTSLFNKKTYEKLGWHYWFITLMQLADHLEAVKAKNFAAPQFRVKVAQMQRFIQRLALSGPYELADADVAAIKRRYSGWVGEAWCWTFQSFKDNQSQGLFCFPWRALRFNQSLCVKRHLDYPVSQWDVVEPLLKEDLDKLCRLGCWSSGDKINTLYWKIRLFNLQDMDVAISFRNPYSLHTDAPEFKAALYQAYYAYVALMEKLTSRDKDLDLPQEMPFISWQIEIKQRLHIPQIILDLFENEKEGANYKGILDLQNCLPQAIEYYVISPDFMPEQLFFRESIGYQGECDFSLKQWVNVLLRRPLFYYRQPRLIKDKQQTSCQFLERTAYNWWRSENIRDLVRDYFLLKNQQGQYFWVFKNSAGEWYRHGIYS